MKKRIVSLLIAFSLILVACMSMSGCSNNEEQPKDESQKKITLKYSILENEDHGQGVLLKTFKQEVETLSNGEIEVELYFNGSLYTQDGALPALRKGDLEMSNISLQLTADYLPSIAMFASDYMFKGYDHMRKVVDSEIGDTLADQIKKAAGYYPLGYYYNGSRQLNLRQEKPIKTPADMKGVVLRMATSEAWIQAGEALGATVSPMAYGEVYTALSTGTIDAQDNPMPGTYNSKFHEVTKQLCLTYHIVDFGLIALNADTWDSLTEEQQGWLKTAADKAAKACDKIILDQEDELIETFKNEGLIITEPDIDAFAEYAHDYYTKNNLTKDWDMELYDKVQKMAE